MIKVHTIKCDLSPRNMLYIDKEGVGVLESFRETIPIFYDPSCKTHHETDKNYGADIRFVIRVPEFISVRTGTKEVRGKTMEDVYSNLVKEYRNYINTMLPITKTKVILYDIQTSGEHHTPSDPLKISVVWRILWVCKQSSKYWLEECDGKILGERFDPEKGRTWVQWTEEREAFFTAFSGTMIDLMDRLRDFFNGASMEVEEKIDTTRAGHLLAEGKNTEKKE